MPEPTADDPRKRSLESDVLNNLVCSQYLYEIDTETELAKLRAKDHVAEELIRSLAERFFPGHIDLALKSKVIGTLLVFYGLSGEIPAVLQEMEVDSFLKEIDSLGEIPPETSGDDEGLRPSSE